MSSARATAAHATVRDSRRLVARRGKQTAAIAVGQRILVLAAHGRRDRQESRAPTPRDQGRQRGFAVTRTPQADAAEHGSCTRARTSARKAR